MWEPESVILTNFSKNKLKKLPNIGIFHFWEAPRIWKVLYNALILFKHLFISSPYVLHFEWFKKLWERYFKLLQSSLKCKGKGVMKKYQENKLYNLQNMFFCFSLSLDPSYFQTL